MSDGFVAGFVGRDQGVAQALQAAFTLPEGFAATDIRTRIRAQQADGPVTFSPQAAPRHFAPADPDTNPTEGWDPFNATATPVQGHFSDPIAQAHAAGRAEGRTAALAERGTDEARDEALLASVAEALAADRFDRPALARQLRQTVMLLVGKLIGEVGISPDLLAARVAVAAEHLADAAESAMLRVHPDDVPLLDGRVPKTIFAVGDAAVPRGAFVLEAASTIVEDGPALWLDQLASAIDRVALPDA